MLRASLQGPIANARENNMSNANLSFRFVTAINLAQPALARKSGSHVWLPILLLLFVPLAAQAQLNFGSPNSYPSGTQPFTLAGADLNGDGKLDLAVGNTQSKDVSVLLGNGAGGFQAAVNYPLGFAPSQIATRDLNDDGK